MLINNIDISNFKAKLLKKDIQTAEVVTYDDWLRKALNPLYMGKHELYKQIKIQLYIKDTDDNAVLNGISNLIVQFEKCTIKFDDIDFYYDCLITSKKHTRLAKGKYTLDIELKSGYGYKDTIIESMADTLNKNITVPGNLPTPAVVTITVPIDMISITLTGLGEIITVKNLKANTPITIDGETCIVTEKGANKFAETDMWEFPVLQPGSNTIVTDNVNSTLGIQYKPRWI